MNEKAGEIPIVGSIDDIDLAEKLEDAFRDDSVEMHRNRPYDGQSWTCSGERGKQIVEGLTMRDIRDCFVRAICLSAGHLSPAHYQEAERGQTAKLNLDSLYEIDLSKLDTGAIAQNLTCEIERAMGIFPNLPNPENPVNPVKK